MSVYPGQSVRFEHNGRKFRADIEQDTDTGAPWEECDGHLSITRVNHDYQKRPSEVFLYKGGRHEWSYVYDVREAIATAVRDGWGVEGGKRDGESVKQYALRAIAANAEYLRGWVTDQWCWVYVGVTMVDEEGEDMSETEYLSGCESCGDYVETEVIHELADQCFENTVHIVG